MTELPYVAVRHTLRVLLRQVPAEDFMLKLYIDKHVPVRSNTAASFTEPPRDDYTPMLLVSADWSIQGARAVAQEQAFTFAKRATPCTVHGYFIVTQHSNILYWAERFTDGPYLLEHAHDTIFVQPTMLYAKTV